MALRVLPFLAFRCTLLLGDWMVGDGLGEGHNVPSDFQAPIKSKVFVQI